jgi:hypothetical protein
VFLQKNVDYWWFFTILLQDQKSEHPARFLKKNLNSPAYASFVNELR